MMWGKCVGMENGNWKMEKKEFTQRTLRKSAQITEITEKKAATRGGERASILAKAEPRPVEDEVDRPAAAFVC
jgi:hypothetical protein